MGRGGTQHRYCEIGGLILVVFLYYPLFVGYGMGSRTRIGWFSIIYDGCREVAIFIAVDGIFDGEFGLGDHHGCREF